MIFPDLHGFSIAEVNLDNEARRWCTANPDIVQMHTKNPLLVPQICQGMLDDMHRRLAVVWSYGGWMECRDVLWKDSYMEADKRFNHLGVDFNVPAGTRVQTHRKVEIVRSDDDQDQEGGWGQRLIVQPKEGDPNLLIYGHLARETRCKVGDVIKIGDVFAEVGAPPYNGNWFAHLHVQAITVQRFHELLKEDPELRTLDGYCTTAEKERAMADFPNPMAFL